MKKINILIIIDIIAIISLSTFTISYSFKTNTKNDSTSTTNSTTTTEYIEPDKYTNIVINAVGDCTIGYDDNFGYGNSFNEVVEKNGYDYIFSNVLNVFENDDLTVANLEGTFTDATVKKEKKFNFKGPKDYVNILKSGSIEVVNVANNHSYDYNEIGFDETIETLNDNDIEYFGYDKYYIYTKDNIKIGFGGIHCIEDWNCIKKIDSSIEKIKEENVDLIVLSFHWGIEGSHTQSEIQTYLAHYAIDNGVNLVLGHHPHVLQGIELYNNSYIVYSLANFAFGGNKNPTDKDTMIFNINYTFKNNELDNTTIKVYPTSVSSVTYINDYRPTILTDSEYDRVMNKIYEKSVGITNLTQDQVSS